MAGIEPPREVVARLGPSPRELSRRDSSLVLAGNGLVAKTGPEDRAAREAFVLGSASALLPFGVPALVDSGPGWILMEEVRGDPVDALEPTPLGELSAMHETFAGATGLADPRLRDVFGRERDELLTSARSRMPADMPEPLGSLLGDPSPLIAILEGEPRTLVHGDAWAGNVLRKGPDELSWFDWDDAGSGPAALDVASWLFGTPLTPPSPDPESHLTAYLTAGTRRLDASAFRRSVEAAVVLRFLLLDFEHLGEGRPDLGGGIVGRRNDLAKILLS